MKSQGNLGKIITLGSILTLIEFGVLLKMNKEMMARGVVLAVITVALFTLFIYVYLCTQTNRLQKTGFHKPVFKKFQIEKT